MVIAREYLSDLASLTARIQPSSSVSYLFSLIDHRFSKLASLKSVFQTHV